MRNWSDEIRFALILSLGFIVLFASLLVSI